MSDTIYAEFATDEALRTGVLAVSLHDVEIDLFTPFPVANLEPLLHVKRSTIPHIALAGGVTGALGAYLIQLWCAAIAYPLDVGGRPLHSAPAFIPITFESGILAASLAIFMAVLVKGKLVRLHHPVFEVRGFERATTDRFWLEAKPLRNVPLDIVRLEAELRDAGAIRVESRKAQ